MNNINLLEHQIEERNKILKGLELTFKKLIEFKKQKNSVLVVYRNNKIVHIKPEDF